MNKGIRQFFNQGTIRHTRCSKAKYVNVVDGVIHNEEGPAIIREDGTEEWWYKGKRVTDSYRCVKRTYHHSDYNFERWKNIYGQYHRPLKGLFSGPAKIDHAGKYWFIENRLVKFEQH